MFSDVLTADCLPKGFLCAEDAVSHPQQQSIVTRNTVVLMNVEVPTKYPLSQNNRTVVLKYVSTAKTKCSGNQGCTVIEML
jgi:hypothetical protein